MERREVVIVGSGPAGAATALRLAAVAPDLAARTVLLERYGFFGGNAVSAWVGTICGLYRQTGEGFDLVCRGFAERWAEGLNAAGAGFGPIPYKATAVLLYVPWAYKWQADQWVTAEALTVLPAPPLLEPQAADEVGVARGLLGAPQRLRTAWRLLPCRLCLIQLH